jgi:hypothetical protein
MTTFLKAKSSVSLFRKYIIMWETKLELDLDGNKTYTCGLYLENIAERQYVYL